MTSNSNARTSQIVYTSVDDDMTVTEIICEYDCDDMVTEAVCEVEPPESSDGQIYLAEPSHNDNMPVIKEEKIYIDSESFQHEQNFKDDGIYIDDNSDDPVHQIFAEDKKFKCGVCCEQFDDLAAISRHMEEHSGEKKYECAECGKQFKNINNVMRHMVVHSGERKYMCPICKKPFTQVGNLKRHMFVHSGEKKFPCSTCGKGFTQMNNLIRHQAIHSGVKNFECNICHRLFNQASNLNRHLLIHKGIKLYSCDTCGRSFSQLTNLQKHRERHLRGKKYKCEVCGDGFDHKLMYNKHLENHYGKPRFQCNVCGRVVTQKSTLSQHMLLHFENKKYTCHQCNKCYAQKGSLAKHMEAHNLTKYFCKICNRYFYDEGGLLKHESTHTDKAKSIASMVQKEIRVLDYNLQFCEFCGKSFILKRSLRRHMEKTHNVLLEIVRKNCRENPCEECGKIFVHRKSLKKHMLRKHNAEIEPDAERSSPVIKTEKEDDMSDEENEADESSLAILDKDKITETLLQIKQENVIEADTTFEESEKVWNDISNCKVKEEPEERTSNAMVHLCEICGRGYYLVSNLHRHMEIKHGVTGKGKENVNGKFSSSASVKMVNNFILKETGITVKKLTGDSRSFVNQVASSDDELLEDQTVARGVGVRRRGRNVSTGIEKKGIAKVAEDPENKPKGKRGRKRKFSFFSDADICDICGRGFLTPFDLLLHMLEHSKAKKNELLSIVNEAAQEFQSMKKSEVELNVTEKTKGLVSHFRKCSRNQSNEISSIFSIGETYEQVPFSGDVSPIRHCAVSLSDCEQESITTECVDFGAESKQEVLEINEFDYV
ncbi:zinc finger protein 93-like [Macrobrachium nipponense]|uniref:zinc finger protein 93-like n=1 Tax=Macrobrachium nipponense TaxID=159736 RepID=UPI0030C847DE